MPTKRSISTKRYQDKTYRKIGVALPIEMGRIMQEAQDATGESASAYAAEAIRRRLIADGYLLPGDFQRQKPDDMTEV